MGEECGLSCATALRGARRSYSSTEPAEVVVTMSGWWRETMMRLTTVLGSAAGPLSSMGICTCAAVSGRARGTPAGVLRRLGCQGSAALFTTALPRSSSRLLMSL